MVNVIRGEMSLVGPRPERPEFVSVLAESIEGVPGAIGRCPRNHRTGPGQSSAGQRLGQRTPQAPLGSGVPAHRRALVGPADFGLDDCAGLARIPEFLILRLGVDYQVPGWVCQVARKTVSSGPAVAATLPESLGPGNRRFRSRRSHPCGVLTAPSAARMSYVFKRPQKTHPACLASWMGSAERTLSSDTKPG